MGTFYRYGQVEHASAIISKFDIATKDIVLKVTMIHKSFAGAIDPTVGHVVPPVGQMSNACRGRNLALQTLPTILMFLFVWNDVMRKGQKTAIPYPQKDISQEHQERPEQHQQHQPQYDVEKQPKEKQQQQKHQL